MKPVNNANLSISDSIVKLLSLLSSSYKKALINIVLVAVSLSIVEILCALLVMGFARSLLNPDFGHKYLSYIFSADNLTHKNTILFFSITFALAILLKCVLTAGMYIHQNKKVQSMKHSVSTRLLKKFMSMEYLTWINRETSLTFSVLTHDLEGAFSIALVSLLAIFSELMTFLMLFSIITYLQPALATLISALIVAFGIILNKKILPVFYAWGKELQSLNLLVSKRLLQMLSGYKEILLFSAQEHFVNDYDRLTKKKSTLKARSSASSEMPRLLVELIFALVFSSITVFFVIRNNKVDEMLGVFSGYFYLAYRVMPGLNRLMTQLNKYKSFIPSIERLAAEYKTGPSATYDNYKLVKASSFNNSIVFNKVSFRYPNRPDAVLEEVSLTINCGDYIGIIGCSGSGKSTLVHLIAGLLKPTHGFICVDGINNPRQYNLISCIGYVPQDVHLMDDSIASNIALGLPENKINYELINSLIKIVQLEPFIDKCSDGLHTLIGERGVRLSGGEKQRVAIARALYKRPKVIIFDEATSALDTITEKKIINLINQIASSYTIIMVAHRLSTLRECSRLIEVVDGQLIEKQAVFEGQRILESQYDTDI